MKKNNLNRDDFVMVRVHNKEKEKLKKLREKQNIRDNPKMFRELLRKAKV